jgi:hypothetical protein
MEKTAENYLAHVYLAWLLPKDGIVNIFFFYQN